MSLPSGFSADVKEQAGLTKDHAYTASGDEVNNRIELGANIVYDILTAEKNGNTLTQGSTDDYTWNTHQPFITLNTAPSSGDFFYFKINVRMRDSRVQAEIDRVHSWGKSMLLPVYDVTVQELDDSPTFQDLLQDWAAGRILMLRTKGNPALESATYRTGRAWADQALEQVRQIRKGRDNLFDSSGNALTRTAGSLVGGDLSLADADRPSRHEHLENMHEYDDNVQDFMEEVDGVDQ